jgi:hypothetical protein
MEKSRSFKFLDPKLHSDLIRLFTKAKVEYSVNEKDGAIHYSVRDEASVENDLICSVRDKVFPSWQVLTCPSDWIPSYRDYMTAHGVPCQEELSDGELWFLIPRRYRPNTWKLGSPVKSQRLAV